MTGGWLNRLRRRTPVALSVGLGLLLISCDGRTPPNGPSPPPPPPPPPAEQRSRGPLAFVSNRDGPEKIYLANEDGSAATPLAAGMAPAWAKDGRQIAFSAGPDIHVIGVDGSGERVIARGAYPSWSPDGRSCVFLAYYSGPSRIELMNVDGSNRRLLFDAGGYGWVPKWSPDGQKILVVMGGGFLDNCFGLWTVNARQPRFPFTSCGPMAPADIFECPLPRPIRIGRRMDG